MWAFDRLSLAWRTHTHDLQFALSFAGCCIRLLKVLKFAVRSAEFGASSELWFGFLSGTTVLLGNTQMTCRMHCHGT